MPNWCVGDLKVRGKYGKIKEFLTEEFFILGGRLLNRSTEPVKINEQFGIEIDVGVQGMWLKKTRSFIAEDVDVWIDFEDEENKSDKEITVNLGMYRSAWGLEINRLVELSAQYGIDIKIYAYECGMEFNVDFEVHKGEIIKMDEITFDDYEWECPNARLGG